MIRKNDLLKYEPQDGGNFYYIGRSGKRPIQPGDEVGVLFRGKESEMDARRIVACVNACKGISTDRLEKMVPGTLANLLTLKGEVDGLAKKLEESGLLRAPRGDWPDWATHRATDANGAVYFYASKPEPGQATWMQPSVKRNLPDTSVATNWKDTLETRDEPLGLEVRKG